MGIGDDPAVVFTAEGRLVTKAERLADLLQAALTAILAEPHHDEATVAYLRDAVSILRPEC